MLYTEAEAKKKWCPFSRTAFQYRAGAGNGDCMIVANRAETDEPLSLCLASGCMAWRWGMKRGLRDMAVQGGIDAANKTHGAPGPANPEWYATRDRVIGEIATAQNLNQPGFCGLAGKPE